MRFAVVGDPIAHSRSPAMHAAAYRALGLPHTYEAIQAKEEDLPTLVRELRDGVYDGLNVTVPHKGRITRLVDAVDRTADGVGAANTLVRTREGRIVAHNTDVPALAAELAASAPDRARDDWARAPAIVLGSGGAARAAIAALRSLGVTDLIIRARRGAEPLAPTARDREVLTIVQATSAGMHGADPGDAVASAIGWDDLPRTAIAYDVIYAPPETPFLRAAREHGIGHANGLGMLARQGALAFELWLGVPAPYDAMLAALL